MAAKLCVIALLLFSLSARAQNPFLDDANGRPQYLTTSYHSEGSPYFHDEYNTAEITSLAGKVYRDVKVKVNLTTNEILYRTGDGKEMVAILPIKRIKFAAWTLESFGQPINSPNTLVYQVLDSGKCTLLKQVKITYRDDKPFNQASVTRIFKRDESFHVLIVGGMVQKLNPGKDDMLDLLKDKQAQVRTFIESNKLKCRQEEDYRKVIAYYNSL